MTKKLFLLIILLNLALLSIYSGTYYKTKELNKSINKTEKNVNKSIKEQTKLKEECASIINFLKNRNTEGKIMSELIKYQNEIIERIDILNPHYSIILETAEVFKTTIKGQKTIASNEPEFKKVKEYNKILKKEINTCNKIMKKLNLSNEKFFQIIHDHKLIMDFDIKKSKKTLEKGIENLEETVKDIEKNYDKIDELFPEDEAVEIKKDFEKIIEELNKEKEIISAVKNELEKMFEIKRKVTYKNEEYTIMEELTNKYDISRKKINKQNSDYNKLMDKLNKKIKKQSKK